MTELLPSLEPLRRFGCTATTSRQPDVRSSEQSPHEELTPCMALKS